MSRSRIAARGFGGAEDLLHLERQVRLNAARLERGDIRRGARHLFQDKFLSKNRHCHLPIWRPVPYAPVLLRFGRGFCGLLRRR
jgi:hypothetical protein